MSFKSTQVFRHLRSGRYCGIKPRISSFHPQKCSVISSQDERREYIFADALRTYWVIKYEVGSLDSKVCFIVVQIK